MYARRKLAKQSRKKVKLICSGATWSAVASSRVQFKGQKGEITSVTHEEKGTRRKKEKYWGNKSSQGDRVT